MKAQRLLRMMRTGEVYSGRTVLVLPMPRAAFDAVVAPRNLYWNVRNIKSAVWTRGSLELLVKLFPEDHDTDHWTARSLARHLRAMRRAGVSLRGLRVMPYRHRERKADLDNQRVSRAR